MQVDLNSPEMTVVLLYVDRQLKNEERDPQRSEIFRSLRAKLARKLTE